MLDDVCCILKVRTYRLQRPAPARRQQPTGAHVGGRQVCVAFSNHGCAMALFVATTGHGSAMVSALFVAATGQGSAMVSALFVAATASGQGSAMVSALRRAWRRAHVLVYSTQVRLYYRRSSSTAVHTGDRRYDRNTRHRIAAGLSD